MIEQLKQYELVYLATPYSKYKLGLEWAFIDACRLAGRLLQKGLKLYSPIAHTHPIAIYAEIDPLDHKVWLPFDEAIMAKSDCLLVAMMEGWEDSYGIAHEIGVYKASQKPIYYLNVETYQVLDHPRDSQAQGAMVSGNLAR